MSRTYDSALILHNLAVLYDETKEHQLSRQARSESDRVMNELFGDRRPRTIKYPMLAVWPYDL
jgi:hypothetical protein